jgi:hypothetical protein
MADRNQDGLTGWRKTQGNWVVEVGGRMPRIEDAGDISLSRPRLTHGCRADDDEVNSLYRLLLLRNSAEQHTWVCNIDRMQVKTLIDGAERMGEEAVVAYFNVLSRLLAGDTEAQKYLSI